MENLTDPNILPMTPAEMENYRLHRRFDRMGRLVGDSAMQKLMNAHVMVIGLGGVGSFAAEALARSGVGRLSLVDFDEVCITNFNRQLHAVGPVVGEKKALVMADRISKINPQCKAEGIVQFYNARLSEEIFALKPDYIIDAIDSVTSKCHLLAECLKRGIPVITSTGSGGRLDPSKVKAADLSETIQDPLARAIRKILRDQYEFPRSGKFGIQAVFSDEQPTMPIELHYDGGKGFRCVCPQGKNEFFNCDSRNIIMGNASFVTGAFGLQCASLVVRLIIGDSMKSQTTTYKISEDLES